MNVETISEKILVWLNVPSKVDRIDYLKCKLGLELLLINLTNLLIIYTVAILLGILKETLAIHIPYMILRNSAFGVHSESIIRCTIDSLIFFILVPWGIKNYFQLNLVGLIILFLLILLLILKYAPGDSSKYKVEESRRRKLKKDSLMIVILFGLVLMGDISILHKNLIILGLSIETFMITPFARKINL